MGKLAAATMDEDLLIILWLGSFPNPRPAGNYSTIIMIGSGVARKVSR